MLRSHTFASIVRSDGTKNRASAEICIAIASTIIVGWNPYRGNGETAEDDAERRDQLCDRRIGGEDASTHLGWDALVADRHHQRVER